ncbi:hypothetical protein IU474_01570 [Nocardia otitidiscaviarum]|uniref:hypothetical protein n=1 Tax=Nocardia otitidiscaviarum TaxID=1823 RepID=UPI0018960530|nr:hypothetical protein [Nocardia otitidiscaviarum]MBF6235770.1 hypothetical protein [Nocardia otitidiscaviarum]
MVTPTHLGGGGIIARADLSPGMFGVMDLLSWGQPLLLRGDDREFIDLDRNDLFAAVVTMTGRTTVEQDSSSGFPEADVVRVVRTGHVQ